MVLQQFVALHIGQAEIEDDQIRSLAEQFERRLAVGRFQHLIALGGQAHAQQLADRRLVIDHQHAERSGAHAAASKRCRCARDRQADGERRAAAVGAVGRDDGAMHRLDKAAGNRQPQPGAGANLVGLLRAIEFVEDVIEIAGRNAAPLIENAQADRVRVLPALDADRRLRRARISRHCRGD